VSGERKLASPPHPACGVDKRHHWDNCQPCQSHRPVMFLFNHGYKNKE
jgi:hypothetical protein